VRYGSRAPGAENPEALMTASRNAGFGDEVKLRILLGTYVLRSGFQDEYYLRAQRIRTAIRNDFASAFEGVDLILMPVYPVPPFVRGSAEADPFTQKLADIFTCSANLAGLPALAFPAGVENGLPIGMQFLAPAFAEDRLIETCRELEPGFPSPDPPGFPAEWR
jgi:aspartyl-tRNA(Asn)/glutamyl-tRNA(Gln) amidotransferase subunit A